MDPLEYVSLTFEGVKMAEFDYPSEEDNFWIASKSLGSSQMMINGAYAA